MKLSEAIRLGAMLKPQGILAYFEGGRTCAIGAALDAIGRLEVADHDRCVESHRSAREFGWLLDEANAQACPACRDVIEGGDISTIPHLNDDHKWTREQIADWVATIEAQHERTAIAVRVDAGGVPC